MQKRRRSSKKRTSAPLQGMTLVLDPGHGGSDPGASCGGVTEAALTYRMALTIAICAKAAGAKVYFTVRSAALRLRMRDPNHEPPLRVPTEAVSPLAPTRVIGAGREDPRELYQRARVAARYYHQAERRVVFLSLHFDANLDPTLHGGHVIYDYRATAQPPRLARALSQMLQANGLCGNRPPVPVGRDLGVLNPAHNPIPGAVLVELATLTNSADRRRIVSPTWRWHVARLLVSALVRLRP